MSHKHFSFVILHYYTEDDTIKCINSIKEKCKNKSYSIVVVDNASPNNTGKELYKKYRNDAKVHVIINKKNLGFARGNNVGFKYAKKELKADYIILCNNDTYLLQDNFIELIEEEYKNSNFSVLGPKIILRNNKINGLRKSVPTIKRVKKIIRTQRFCYITTLLYINNLYIDIKKTIKNILVRLKIKNENNSCDESYNIRHEDIVLHGCFLIFSKKYINLFDGLDDRTFLYMEEDLLAIRLKKYNLKSVYSPKIIIFHNEDGATNAVTKSSRKKKLFVSKNCIKSAKIVLSELENQK